jgi:hypothetical protein
VNIKVNAGSPVMQIVADSGEAKTALSKQSAVTKKKPSISELRAEKLQVNLNGQLITVPEGQEIIVPRDKPLILKGVQSNSPLVDNAIFANLKGFAPPKSNNDGNDINFAVYPDQDLWKRYSEDKQGLRYPVYATYKNQKIGTFWIRLEEK